MRESKQSTSGRCVRCLIRFVWPKNKPKLRHAFCPLCSTKLHRTTHLWQGKNMIIQKNCGLHLKMLAIERMVNMDKEAKK